MSIKIESLTHVYMPGSPFEKVALKDINLTIDDNDFVALIGHTGSGKSTLIQHLNGLLSPTKGKIYIDGIDITEKNVKLVDIRKKVGLVFQYSEYQLFEETIEKDIAFGPKNFGVEETEASQLVRNILPVVGLDESYLDRSPFELSGGQKRRVAIAGILVLDPKVLVLDEPTAGLDPQGAKEMMTLFMRLNREQNKTVLLVTHDMEHVMKYCDHVIVLDHGAVKQTSDVKTFFEHPEWIVNIGINPPSIIRLKMRLKEAGFDIPDEIIDED